MTTRKLSKVELVHCKNKKCNNPRRKGEDGIRSAYCQECSNKHNGVVTT